MKKLLLLICTTTLVNFGLHAQSISNFTPSTYTENDGWVYLDQNVSVSSGTFWDGGYLEFDVTNVNDNSDEFRLLNGSGYTISGNNLLNSSNEILGSIDPVYNGQSGQKLRINFSSPFTNASFEDDLTGWTIVSGRINLGSTSIAGWPTIESDPYPGNVPNKDNNNPASASYNHQLSTSVVSSGSKSLRLFSSMTTANDCDVVHGPGVYSDPFQATAGDVIYFDWRAVNGGDDFDVFGYILNTSNGAITPVINANGGQTSWATASVSIPASGSYRFVFVNGTHDRTCGRAAGASLYIDNVRVFGSKVDDLLIRDIIEHTQFRNDCGNNSSNRTISVFAQKGTSGSANTSGTMVFNTFAPVAIAQNVTITLDANGNASLSPSQVDNGSYDVHCGISSRSLTKTSFNCNDKGTTAVTLTVADSYGATDSETITVTVLDQTPPVMQVQNATVYLDATGNASISVSDINNGTSDACDGTNLTLSLDKSTFDCTDIQGLNNTNNVVTVTLTAEDQSGNINTATANVTVIDNISPNVICKIDTVYMVKTGIGMAEGILTPDSINDGTSDNCSIAQYAIISGYPNPYTFNDTGLHVVTMRVHDVNGNFADCTTDVQVIGIPPEAQVKPLTVDLGTNNLVSIQADQFDSLSYIPYGTGIFYAETTSGDPLTFDCSDVGVQNIMVVVTDDATNLTDTAYTTVTIVDNVTPSLTNMPSNMTVSNDAGDCGAVVSYSLPNIVDNCLNSTMPLNSAYNFGGNTFVNAGSFGNNVFAHTASYTVEAWIKPDGDGHIFSKRHSSVGAIALFGRVASNGTLTFGIDDFTSGGWQYLNSGAAVPFGQWSHVAFAYDHTNNTFSIAINGVTANTQVLNTNPGFSTAVFRIGANRDGNDQFQGSIDEFRVWSVYRSDSLLMAHMNEEIDPTTPDLAGYWDFNENSGTTVTEQVSSTSGSFVPTTSAGWTGGALLYHTLVQTTGINSGLQFPVGTTTNTFVVTDGSGNADTSSFDVTVNDTEAPVVNCPADITLTTSAACGDVATFSVTGSDNCTSSGDLQIVQTAGLASGATFPVGVTTNTFTVTDTAGNSTTCSFTVTVIDNGVPTIVANDQTVYLDANGQASITAAQVGAGSGDLCSQLTLTLSDSLFDCSDLGVQTVTLTAEDTSGNVSTATAQITVVDTVPATIAAVVDVTVSTTGPGCGETFTFSLPIVSDNCSSVSVVQTGGPSSGTVFPVGTTTLSFEATDGSGNTSSMSYDVVVTDGTPPTAICQDFTLVLDPTGNATLSPSDIDNGSFDNCSSTLTMSVTPNTFGISDVGLQNVTFTVLDDQGNSDACTATVTVVDQEPPTIFAITDTTIYLDANGQAYLPSSSVDLGSVDSCGTVTLTLSDSLFDCTDLIPNASDFNIPSTVVRGFAGRTVNFSNVNINGGGNVYVASPGEVINVTTNWSSQYTSTYCPGCIQQFYFGIKNVGSECLYSGNTSSNRSGSGNLTMTLPTTPGIYPIQARSSLNFFCSGSSANLSTNESNALGIVVIAPYGQQLVTLTATDCSGNTSTSEITVNISDTLAPVAVCQDLTIYTDASGNASISDVSLLDGGSSDNCGIVDYQVSQVNFTCADIGANVVDFIVSDASGNSDTCQATVTVVDQTAPVAQCVDLDVYLDVQGFASITTGSVYQSITDNCAGVDTAYLSQYDFSCSDVGSNTITLTVSDIYGNTSTCDFTVTVIDTVSPVVQCQDRVLSLDAQTGLADLADLGLVGNVIIYMTDNCGIATTTVDKTLFDCSDIGTYMLTATVTDVNGNVSTCTSTITIEDATAPLVSCQPATLSLDGQGSATLSPSAVIASSSDACGIDSSWTIPSEFTCADLGDQPVTVYVRDNGGNVSSCTTVVTVVDDQAPVWNCPGTTLTVNLSDAASITGIDWTSYVTDNCGTPVVTTSLGTIDCQLVGTTSVTITATDASGNSSTCQTTLEVVDDIAPVIACPVDVTIQTNGQQCQAVADWTLPTGSDNCDGNPAITQIAGPMKGSMQPTGSYTVSYEVMDASGNADTCSFVVTIEDLTAPAFLGCPTNQVLYSTMADCDRTASWTAPTAADACGTTPVVQTQGLPSGSMFPVGTTYIEYVATDASGNNDTCGFTITVIDQIAPIVSCPLPQVVSADAGQCGATVSWSAPGATDNCGVANVQRIDNLPVQSGDFLAVGTYVLTYQYTDASGNSSVCSKVIVVEDREAPVLSCSSDFTQSADSGLCSAVVTYNTPTATDNCDQALNVTQIAGLASGSTFPVGTTTNTFVVTDNAGNSDTCSFDVTVIDQSTPVISCLADIVASADTGSCTAIVTYTPPTATTSCGGVISTQQIEGLSSGSAFPLGVTVNTFVAIGLNGQNDTCSFTVTVEDVSAPVFTVCPSDQELFSTSISCDRVASWTAPVAQDNCGGVTVVQTQGPVSGSSFAPGVTLIEYTATDGSGNSSTCSFTITVTDQVDPQVSCPAPMVLESDPVQCGAIVNWTIPSATDNCGIDTIVRIDNEPFDMGDFVPVGTYVVSYEYIDVNGNSTVCNMAIEVEDNQPPVLTCPSDVVQSSDNGLCSAVVNYTVPSAVDNCSQVSAVVQIAGLPSGGMFPIGVTTNTFVVSDDQGNSDTCSFTVTITDSEAPMLACPADLTVQAVTGSCDATVTYNLPTATDNCDQSPTVMQIAGLASGSTFPVGVTTNTFVATDSNGNSDTCSFTVTVEEMTPPVLSCAQDVYALADAGSCDAVVNYTAPTVFDNCDANPTVTQISGLPSGSTFPIGVTTNTFVAVDFSGNSDTCSFTVTVEDDQAPVVSCPSDISQSNDPGSCGAVVSYALPTGVDNCSGSVTVTQTSGLASGSTFPVGVTTNTFTLTDGNGNSTTCSFTVTVVDTQSPVITCPLDITQSNDPGLCGATVSYGLPTVSGNCSGNLSITQTAGLSSGSFFPVGSTVNTFVVTDAAGNSSSCSFTVTVNDTEAPVVSCPADITTSSVSGVCGAPVSFTRPVVLQSNCSGVSIQRTDNTGLNSGDVFPIGVTTLTWSITDASGNSTSCSQTITVTDIVAPTVSCPANITVGNDPGSCSAVVNYTAPTGTDNCGSVTVTQTGGLPSGSSFPVGTTVNTFTVSDGSGNSSTCSFTVTVNDTEAPTISCPSNITTTSQFSQCGEIVTYTAPTVTDNCSGNLSIQQTAGLASGSLFPVGTTTNTFVVTDGSGNTATCSFTVTVQQGFTVTLPNDTAHCGPYTLSAALVTGGQYLWSTGSVSPTITITQSGTYSVTVTNSGGCVDSDQINVTINTPPTASIVGLNNFYCVYDASISLVGTPAGGTFSGPGVSGGNFDPAQAGNGNHVITYSYTDNNGCTVTASQSLTVSECVSLEEQWIETVSVYPNPFSSSFEVIFTGNSTEAMTMELTDMTGRIIYSETVYPQVGENRYQITPEHLAASVYYLTLRQGETITTEKLVKGK